MARGRGRALRGELFRLRRGIGLRVCLAAPAAAAGARIALGRLQGIRSRFEAGLGGAQDAPEASANAYGPFVDGLTTGFLVTGLILIILSAQALARDRELGVARLLVTGGVSRTRWVLARFSGLLVLLAVAVGSSVAGAYLAAKGFYEFGPIVEDGFEIFSAAEVRQDIYLGLVTAVLPLLSAIACGLLLSVLLPSSTAAVSLALITTLCFDVLKNLLGDAQFYVYASFQPTLLDQSFLHEVSQVARGYSDAGYTPEQLWWNLWIPAPEAAVFLALTLAVAKWRKL